jgi:hypothetical protein
VQRPGVPGSLDPIDRSGQVADSLARSLASWVGRGIAGLGHLFVGPTVLGGQGSRCWLIDLIDREPGRSVYRWMRSGEGGSGSTDCMMHVTLAPASRYGRL